MLNLSHPTIDIAITCSNFAESLDFYRNKLELKIVLEMEIPEALARNVGLAPSFTFGAITRSNHLKPKAGLLARSRLYLEDVVTTPEEFKRILDEYQQGPGSNRWDF